MSEPAEPREEPTPGPERNRAQGGIPEVPEGSPQLGESAGDADEGAPPGPTPAFDFWNALYSRRSIRKFKPEPVPRELVSQVLHAGIWAPSSCNYQMWDFVAVDDAALNAQLAQLSTQMGNAPVNIVVAYGRDFSEEAWANIQSASAAIQNMSLAAQVLGLGTFWITQTGDREKVRELVGLPEDRLVVAVLALGWPKFAPRKGPKRRPLAQVSHWNHYAGRPIPSSPRPQDWASDLLAIYQRARVLNGLRHNKPRAWEVRALAEALESLVPRPGEGARWLDVLPCTGIVTERLARERPGYRFEILERTREVADFVAARTNPRARAHVLGAAEGPEQGAFAIVSCLFRLENCAQSEREELLASMARWVAPQGRVLIGFVNANSFHDFSEWLRSRRAGPRGVEYVLAPDPSIGPFQTLDPRALEALARENELVVEARYGCQAVPPREEIEFRARNFSARSKRIARAFGWCLEKLEWLPGLRSRRGRFQFLLLKRA
ncbi:MAG: nitroreductase family protein [Planctomycetes bacterium]|nr:nitroreductase family protein [Planctomycetota bacterium]